MSFHYWRNVGHGAKRRFVTLSGSYHGETLGALAVGNVELYKEVYQPLLMDVITVPSPDAFNREAGVSEAAWAQRQFAHMERVLAEHAHEVAAVIVEPLVQCAAGMRMYDPLYLRLLRAACERHRVHLIADEIAVGFGRTGTLFACEQAGIRPDFMCLSKGLTGGYLPLSVVLTTDGIYEAFYDEYVKLNAFLHSHSYTGNALACAAALATLDIFKQDPVLERNRVLAQHFAQATAPLTDHPHVAEVRQRGMITAFEIGAGQARPRTLSVAGAPRPDRVSARPVAWCLAAADRQCRVFHAPLHHRARAHRAHGGSRPRGLGAGDMRLNRVHVEAAVGGRVHVELDGTAANHVARVLRLRAGDPLILFDNAGGEYAATVVSFGRDTVRVAVGEHDTISRESPLRVTLAQGISRGERMDVVVQKATELGVWRIVPLLTERTVVRLNEAQAANRLRHWRAIVVAACEQCGRNDVPQVTAPMGLQEFLVSDLPEGLRLLLNPDGGLKARDLPASTATTLLIGPEGGLSATERTAAGVAQFQGLSLGPRILRTETAALAALAIIQQQARGPVGRRTRQAARVSSAIISSRRSISGTSGVSLSMRTWQITGVRSANTFELSGRTTSELTRTSCGKPCDTRPKYPPSSLSPMQWKITTRVRPAAGGMFCPQAPSNDTSGTCRPFHAIVPMYPRRRPGHFRGNLEADDLGDARRVARSAATPPAESAGCKFH